MDRYKLSVIVVSYNMGRELPRTILSLSPAMQRDILPDDYEIIIVDNGSKIPPDLADYESLCPHIRIHHVQNPTPSPVRGINEGLRMAQGDLVSIMIDGARMASPRLLATALEAAAYQDKPVIGTLAFHLGPELQKLSIAKGYCQAVEDDLLNQSGWENDGYQLFNISVFAGSSTGGWFVIPAETNALFLRRAHWQSLGGYDEAFAGPGGGLANLDIWQRLCAAHNVTLLLGEATFHQVHGGVATNASTDRWPEFHAEYMSIRGKPYVVPTGTPLLFGRWTEATLPSVRQSADYLLSKRQ